MKANGLKKPLISSAVLLLFISLVVYLTTISSEGSIFASLGTILVGFLRLCQWLVGLVLGLVVSLAVLIGIFLGAMALVDPARASSMYASLREVIRGRCQTLANVLPAGKRSDRETRLARLESLVDSDLPHEFRRVRNTMESALEQGLTAQRAALQAVEARLETMVNCEELDRLHQSLAEEHRQGLAQLVHDMARLEEQLKVLAPLEKQLTVLEQRLHILETREHVDLTPLEKRLQALESRGRTEEEQTPEPRQATSAPGLEQANAPGKATEASALFTHRIFSYFEDETAKIRLQELVASTLKKDMTYKRVINFLIREMGDQGQVVREHPALAKDYIRQCRRAS